MLFQENGKDLMVKKLKNKYLTHMEPYKIKLDSINYKEETLNSNVVNVEKKSIVNDAS